MLDEKLLKEYKEQLSNFKGIPDRDEDWIEYFSLWYKIQYFREYDSVEELEEDAIKDAERDLEFKIGVRKAFGLILI